MKIEELYGRQILVPACDIPTALPAAVEVKPTMRVTGQVVTCLRCGSQYSLATVSLPNGQAYCPGCINLGRVSTLDRFYHVPEPNQFQPPQQVLTWQGQLSPLQAKAAQEVAHRMAIHQHQLLWAVTGAGKTEMLFPALAAALKRGERVALASPRIDVVLELYPRLQAAFKQCKIALLHGQATVPYRYRQLTICTTHQLLRFYHAFDNLIVDEVDAFPYAMNPRLIYATHQAIKQGGGLLYLTATPGPTLRRQIRQGKLAVTYLPLRYHGHLLPTIHLKLCPGWRKQLANGRLPGNLMAAIVSRVRTGRRFLLFVPYVADLASVGRALARQVAADKFELVHAADPDRLAKVQAMRDGHCQFLVTTTIMERGVTFPKIDVIVLGADDPVFSESALVQIAGRAGRSVTRPTGWVLFWCGGLTNRVLAAQRQIKALNHRGRLARAELGQSK